MTTGRAQFHEIGFYFLMHLPPDSPLRQQTSFLGHEGDLHMHFEWYPVATLEKVVLFPTFLRTGLKNLPTSTSCTSFTATAKKKASKPVTHSDPLRVCIDVSAAVHQRAGLGRYAQELVKGLVDLGRGEASPQESQPIDSTATANTPIDQPDWRDASPLQLTAFYHQRGEAHLDPPIDRLPRLTTRLSVRPWRLTTALAYFTGIRHGSACLAMSISSTRPSICCRG